MHGFTFDYRRGWRLTACLMLLILVATPVLAAPLAQEDLPSYDEEVLAKLNVDNAYEMVRHLAVDIGPRLSGTPETYQAAVEMAGALESYGFEASIVPFDRPATNYTANVTSPNRELPGGVQRWQMRSASNAKLTGDADPVEAEVVSAGTGQSLEEFPPDTAGKIVIVDYNTNASNRNLAVANAVSLGAVGVILVRTEENSAPPSSFILTPAQPDVVVVGAASAHRVWLSQLLAGGPVRLRIVTNVYMNVPGYNVIGVKHAVNDPAGTTAPIVIVGGHYDTVLGSPGAHDNATGPSVALEIARVAAQYEYDKEVRVVAWDAEEGGLRGARAYVNALTPEERLRYVGYWNMDMVGTPNPPAGFWAHTTTGARNFVTDTAYDAAARIGFTGLNTCWDSGGSDHTPFAQAGIPAAFFIWEEHIPPPPPDTCATAHGRYISEWQYHRPYDTMDNVSYERLGVTVKVVGDAFIHSAMNAVTLTAQTAGGTPLEGATIRADCGEGWRNLGVTGSDGILNTAIPHATCDFSATAADGLAVVRLHDVDVFGDLSLSFPAPPELDPYVEPDPVLLNGSAVAYPNVTYSAFEVAEASCGALDTSSVGLKTVACTVMDIGGNTAVASAAYNVVYGFSGFYRPVDDPPALNKVNAGQIVPLIWRLIDANGDPVSGLAEVKVTASGLACEIGTTPDQTEEFAAGNSGLQYLGDGTYQFNWATPKAYAISCKTLMLDLGEGPGMERTALFQFVK